MRKILSILDFDGSYENQSFYRRHSYEWIDFRRLANTSRLCSLPSFEVIRRRLQLNPRRLVTFIGSGNYHYVALALIGNRQNPFTLVLFDHHTDLMVAPAPDVLSCGSWVRTALDCNLPVKGILIIGCGVAEVPSVPSEYADRVELIADHRFTVEEKEVLSRIRTKDVYVSIDKDALSPSEARTDWDQGTMHLTKMMRIIRAIAVSHNLVGADICGETPLGENFVEAMVATEKNDRANRLILHGLIDIMQKKSDSN